MKYPHAQKGVRCFTSLGAAEAWYLALVKQGRKPVLFAVQANGLGVTPKKFKDPFEIDPLAIKMGSFNFATRIPVLKSCPDPEGGPPLEYYTYLWEWMNRAASKGGHVILRPSLPGGYKVVVYCVYPNSTSRNYPDPIDGRAPPPVFER